MAPEPLADMVTMLPLALPPSEIPPPLAVDVNDNAADEVRAVVVFIDRLLLTDRVAKVAPPEASVIALGLEFTTVTLPVEFTVKLGVVVMILPMVPEPDNSEVEADPVRIPED
jgi:hypothetical protein